MRKVLLVEDSPTQAAIMESSFEQAGLNVSVCYNGEDALKRVTEFSPDLMVLDLQLPGISGIEVCNQLKATAQFRIIPVVIYSAENALKYMVAAYEAGADYYVVKDENGQQVLKLLLESVLMRRNRSWTQPHPILQASVA